MTTRVPVLSVVAATSLIAGVAVGGFLPVPSAQANQDRGFPVRYGPSPAPMSYGGLNGFAMVSAKATPTSRLGNDFSSAFRGEVAASGGGTYGGGVQTAYAAFNSGVDMAAQGQGIGYFTYVTGYGKGNALGANFGVSCYGGGEADAIDSTPECSPLGEHEADQGTRVFEGRVAGDPGRGATILRYSPVSNEAVLGARAILNRSRALSGAISGMATCKDGVVQVVVAGTVGRCPLNPCPEGSGTSCTVVTVAGKSLPTAHQDGYYFKLSPKSQDVYPPPCLGDDVLMKNDGASPVCVGHWYKAQNRSENEIVLYGVFDNENLHVSAAGDWSHFLELEGIEPAAVDPRTHILTLGPNDLDWSDGDSLYSPPDHVMALIGVNLIFRKHFKTGQDTAPSEGVRINNLGPEPMDDGIRIAGTGNFRTAIRVEDTTPRTVGLWFASDVGAAVNIRSSDRTGSKNVISMGNDGQGRIYYDASAGAVAVGGTTTEIAKGIYPDGGGVKHRRVASPTVPARSSAAMRLAWRSSFPDTDYTVTCTFHDTAGQVTVHDIREKTAAGVVAVLYNPGPSAHVGELNCVAFHD